MSVFQQNICPYCYKNFTLLTDLIIHIEIDHLDFDPDKVEQLEEEQPEYVPMSYVLKFSSEEQSVQYSENSNRTVIETSESGPLNNNYLRFDDEQKANIEIKTKEEIMALLGGDRLFTHDIKHKKPFACNLPGCQKRYKNVNGIKYHYKKHHHITAAIELPKKTPTLNTVAKRSLLKSKLLVNKKKDAFPGTPLVSYKLQQTPNDVVYSMSFDDSDSSGSSSFHNYAVPTSDFQVSIQVPLPNMSFNANDLLCDSEDFSEKISNIFLPIADEL